MADQDRERRSIAGRSVLVTGGCGFIGGHLVRGLRARGAARIVVVDSMRCGDPENLAGAGAVDLVRFTLGTDSSARLREALRGVDFVFHLAAEKHQAEADRPREILRANIEGTHQLLEAVVSSEVDKVIFASSLYAHGRLRGEPLDERDAPSPTTVYGLSKLAGEHLFASFAAARGLAYNTLRYFFVYGPRQFAGQGYKSVILKTAERLLAGSAPVVFGDGEQTLDYIFVDDVVEATIRALEAPVCGEIINVGTGAPTTVNHLIDTLIAIARGPREKVTAPPDWTTGTRRLAAVDKARELLGFRATTSLEEGLARTFDWLARSAAPTIEKE